MTRALTQPSLLDGCLAACGWPQAGPALAALLALPFALVGVERSAGLGHHRGNADLAEVGVRHAHHRALGHPGQGVALVSAVGGSPGRADPAPLTVPAVVINEALTHTDLPQVDAIELYNPTTNVISLGGWFLTDDRLSPFKYRIPDQLLLPGDYVTFSENEFNAGGAGFALSSDGDEVFLFSADADSAPGRAPAFSPGRGKPCSHVPNAPISSRMTCGFWLVV